MLCSQCGYENPNENRFCGMCGTKLERVAQHEVAHGGTYADLVRERVGVASQGGEVGATGISQGAEPPPVDRVREAGRNGEDSTVKAAEVAPQKPRQKAVAGPSFLNLEVPVEPQRKADQTISGPSFLGLADEGRYNIDYLLEDEPKESHWRLWLVLIILALFGVMAWLQLRHSGIDVASLMQRLRQAKLSTTEEQTHPTNGSGDAGSIADVAKSPQPAQNAAGQSSAPQNTGAPAAPAGATADQNNAGTNPAQAGSADAGKTSGSADQSKTATASDASTSAKPDTAATGNSQAAEQSAGAPAPSADKSTLSGDTSTPASAAGSKTQNAATAGNPLPKKPTAPLENAPAKALGARDAQGAGLVASGEKYLYGRGVAPNCERAISYLRKAADMGNAKGSSHLGAMYATGQCLPMDRVRAYKYFAQALHQDSTNPYFEQNLEMLWNEMSPEEKQQATVRTAAQ